MLPRRLPSNPHVRDLIGVAAYGAALLLIAAAVYAGAHAAVPAAATGVMNVSGVLDSWMQSSPEPRAPSNFEQWLAAREAAERPPSEKSPEPAPVVRLPVPPTGVAAAAKAKAQAEFGRGMARRSPEDATLPPGAQPAEQAGFTPPAANDKHRVY